MQKYTRSLMSRLSWGLAAIMALSTASAQASGCSYDGGPPLAAVTGGFTFYKGIIVQKDLATGKKLAANQAINAKNRAECAQLCVNDKNCTAVTFRNTSHGQCLTFASYDFETNRPMEIVILYSSEVKTSSAKIRSKFQGRLCW